MSLAELRSKARSMGITGASKMNTKQVEAAIAAKQGAPDPAVTGADIVNEFEPIEVPANGDSGKKATVDLDGERIVVTWLCGGVRSFSAEALRRALADFDLVTLYGPDVWFQDGDESQRRYAAYLEDNRFHADDGVTRQADDVPWDKFREALEAAIEAVPAAEAA